MQIAKCKFQIEEIAAGRGDRLAPSPETSLSLAYDLPSGEGWGEGYRSFDQHY
jgi:hypothetical protein